MEGKLPFFYFTKVLSSVAEVLLNGSYLHFLFSLPWSTTDKEQKCILHSYNKNDSA